MTRVHLLNRSIRCGHDVRGEYVVIEPDVRHAWNVSLETGFDGGGKVKSVATRREQQSDAAVLAGRRSKQLKLVAATRYRSACMRLDYLAQGRLDLAETFKLSSVRMSSPLESDLKPFASSSAFFGWKNIGPASGSEHRVL